jgi:hypothetical protein
VKTAAFKANHEINLTTINGAKMQHF